MSMETNSGAPHGGQGKGYERTDADIGSLLKFGLGLFVVLVVVIFAMKWMFFYFAKSQQLGPPASPFENARVLPPQPRLQVEPGLDLYNYCEGQLKQLDTYGWVDSHNGVVRIPVDDAMNLILQRGLPARPAGANAPGGGAAAESGMVTPPMVAHDLQGPCGYIARPPAEEDGK